MHRVFIAIGLLVSMCAQPCLAGPITFTYKQVDIPGALSTTLTGISASREIVGFTVAAYGYAHGFLMNGLGGAVTLIDFPGAANSAALGVSNDGRIVGEYGGPFETAEHGFLLSAGTFLSIDFPGAVTTVASGVNKSGQVVGWYTDGSGISHAFLYQSGIPGGQFVALDTPGWTFTRAYGINDSGDIVGEGYDGSWFRSLLWHDGRVQNISPPWPLGYSAHGINTYGQVVGEGYFMSGGTYSSISFAPGAFTHPRGINDSMDVVGMCQTPDIHGFFATPTPEPSSGLLLIAGLVLLTLAPKARMVRLLRH